ncbi:alpha/beta fold hydrolase [Streptomyces anulatus]
MSASSSSPTPTPSSYKNAPICFVSVQGVNFAYRQLGPDDVPLILLNHLSAVLDNWDPRVVDGLAARRRVITYDNRGVGASGGSTPDTIEAMARDTVLFIRALGFDRVHLLGLSMGGFIAQVGRGTRPRAETHPRGHRPRRRTRHRQGHVRHRPGHAEGDAAAQGPEALPLLHPDRGRTTGGARILGAAEERTDDRGKAISVPSFRAQLKAIKRWGRTAPQDLSRIQQPVLVANGESDRMVPTVNTINLAARLPRGELVPLYPDAGHGGIFQHHDKFVPRALAFLEP